MRHFKYIIILFVLILYSFQGLSGQKGLAKNISQETARQIADKRVVEYKYDLSEMNVSISDKSEESDKTALAIRVYNPQKNIPDVSKREYFIVNYQLKPVKNKIILGGGYCVYVDKHTGEVLLEFAQK